MGRLKTLVANHIEQKGQDSVDNESAAHTDQLGDHQSASSRGSSKISKKLHTLRKGITHPKAIVKSKATKKTAGRLSKIERPFLSKEADLEFLQAHEDLRQTEAKSLPQSADGDTASALHTQRDRVRELEADREKLRVHWSTSRHVQRVCVIPKGAFPYPRMEHYKPRDTEGNELGFNKLEWLGQYIIYMTQRFCAQYIDEHGALPFDADNTRRYVERLLFASAPWQSWAMKVRSVYRWEDPRLTLRWLVLYLVLWYTEHIIGFVYAYILYIVIRNRFAPTSVESLKESANRATNSSTKAEKFVELVDRHGHHDWLNPVMQDIGPYAQIQIGDLANMLECLMNFYAWKRPRKTLATLTFFSTCLLLTLATDMEYCMNIVWFVAGGTFFVCFPIASLYPRYRYLVSPIKWVFWDIPTQAEWSFQYLQYEAQTHRSATHHTASVRTRSRVSFVNESVRESLSYTRDPGGKIDSAHEGSTSSEDEGWHSASSSWSGQGSDRIRSFRGNFQHSLGRLVISSTQIYFTDSASKEDAWTVPFRSLSSLTKLEGGRTSKWVLSSHQLQIETATHETFLVKGLRERDEAFNTIIAFSGVQWQSVQPIPT